jgi:hypothetical protein
MSKKELIRLEVMHRLNEKWLSQKEASGMLGTFQFWVDSGNLRQSIVIPLSDNLIYVLSFLPYSNWN